VKERHYNKGAGKDGKGERMEDKEDEGAVKLF
jgi:hypothetical protein